MKLIRAALFVSLLMVVSSPAATINYGDYLGAGPGEVDFLGVSESSVTDPLPLFGTPWRTGNTLLFSPTGYAASAADGSSDVTASTLEMVVESPDGFWLSDILVGELGDGLLSGTGTAATSATVVGLLVVTNLDTGTVYQAPLSVTPEPPYVLPDDEGFFTWSGDATLVGLFQPDEDVFVKRISLRFDNILSATSEDGTTSFIEKKHVNGTFITLIPEPASLLMLSAGSMMMVLRRRRRT